MPNRILRDGILSSEAVAKLSWAEEVFYRRLHSVADDHGRFHALPKLVRAACYPLLIDKVSDSDIGKWIAACATAGLVRVYPASDGKRYLQIVKFGQQVRAKSKFPDPLPTPDSNCEQVLANAHLDVGVFEGEGELKTSASPYGDAPASNDPIPYQAIVTAYNETMANLPRVREVTPKRRTLIRSAWHASPQRRNIEFWRDAYFPECQDDAFLNGTGPYTNGHENWRPTFDYLMRPEVVTRVFEKAMDRLDRAND